MPDNKRLSAVRFGADGLVPVVTQESRSGDVLMVAFANRDALDRTLATGLAHYYSRSRGALWQKGETSGHIQRIVEVRLDCDGDTLLYRVEQTGPACHTGTRTCFSTVISGAAGRVPSGRLGSGLVVALLGDGELVAMARAENGWLHPSVVLEVP